MKKKRPYTENQYRKFVRLVEMAESRVQMDRINSRLQFPDFILKVGKDICDIMFARLCDESRIATDGQEEKDN